MEGAAPRVGWSCREGPVWGQPRPAVPWPPQGRNRWELWDSQIPGLPPDSIGTLRSRPVHLQTAFLRDREVAGLGIRTLLDGR